MSKKQEHDPSGYKTEEMLKAEAKEQARLRAELAAKRPPPPPGQKKAENYWYHYKWHTIAGIALVVMAAFFIKDMVFRTEPDMTIVMTSQQYVSGETIEALSGALSGLLSDRNGDGKVEVTIDYIYMPPQPTEEELAAMEGQPQMGGQEDYANIMKLTTLIAAGMDPVYLVDDGMYEHLATMAGGEDPDPDEKHTIFQTLEGVNGAEDDRLPLSSTALADIPGCEALGDFTLCLRPPMGNPNQKKQAYYEYCLQALQELARGNPDKID